MRIQTVEVISLAGPPFKQPLQPSWAPGITRNRWGGTLVKVTTDDGRVGWGAINGADRQVVQDWVGPRLQGADVYALERHAQLLRSVGGAWGVEIALWDLIGKAAGQPLYKLWGGYRDRVPGYASCIELRSGEQRAEDTLARQAEGWRATKLRLHDWTVRADIAQVEAVRRALGDDFVIMVDANQAQQPGTTYLEEGPIWSYERALQTARELERLGVYWLEEPLDRYNFDGLRRLCASVDLPIAGGENNRGLHEFRWLIEQAVYDIIQPECLVGETMTGLRKVAGLGEMHHKRVAPHHGGGGIGLAAHLHLACAIPNSTYFEVLFDPPIMSADDFQWYLTEPLRINAAGDLVAPDKPGLGVEPDPDKLAHFRV